MGWYTEQLLPRVVDKALGNEEITEWRRKAVVGLTGTVVEIGFGSGLNLPVYPSAVTKVLAVEPAGGGRKLAAERIAKSLIPVEHIGLDGQSLPLDDASVDGALSTYTLCTVPDPRLAIREIYRVLKPGGLFNFLEHGLSPDPQVARNQKRFEPIQKVVFGGCHLSRDIPSLVTDAGFVIDSQEARYVKGPKPVSWFTVALAHKPLG